MAVPSWDCAKMTENVYATTYTMLPTQINYITSCNPESTTTILIVGNASSGYQPLGQHHSSVSAAFFAPWCPSAPQAPLRRALYRVHMYSLALSLSIEYMDFSVCPFYHYKCRKLPEQH